MKRLFAILALTLVGLVAPASAQKPDPVYNYSDTDEAMGAARDAARRTYAQFLDAFRRAPEGERERDYMVKVGLDRDGGGVEQLRFEGESLVGVLGNEPQFLPGMHRGSRVVVETERVSDWSIITPAGMFGNFTTRVMLPDVDPATAERIGRMLTPNPIPDGWTS